MTLSVKAKFQNQTVGQTNINNCQKSIVNLIYKYLNQNNTVCKFDYTYVHHVTFIINRTILTFLD